MHSLATILKEESPNPQRLSRSTRSRSLSKPELRRDLAEATLVETPADCAETARSTTPLVTIEFCAYGNYERPAARLAAELRDETGCRVRLVPSADGAFEVSVNGRLVFSKRACHRLPETDEIGYHVHNC